LRLVAPARTRTRRTPFVIIVVAVLSLGLVGLIIVSTALQDQAFELADLRQEAAALKLQQQKAQHEVDFLESPASVARRAIDLSMVPNRNPVFLRLSDGSVVGRPAPAAPRTNVKRIDP
jgi:cell division protein FtsL